MCHSQVNQSLSYWLSLRVLLTTCSISTTILLTNSSLTVDLGTDITFEFNSNILRNYLEPYKAQRSGKLNKPGMHVCKPRVIVEVATLWHRKDPWKTTWRRKRGSRTSGKLACHIAHSSVLVYTGDPSNRIALLSVWFVVSNVYIIDKDRYNTL